MILCENKKIYKIFIEYIVNILVLSKLKRVFIILFHSACVTIDDEYNNYAGMA